MSNRFKSGAASSAATPTLLGTNTEQSIAAMPGLRAWYEVGEGLQRTNGFRLRDRISTRKATVQNNAPPVVLTGSHGQPCIQSGYGYTAASTIDRGGLLTTSSYALLSATAGYTIFTVTRTPTVASGESATLGGYVWSTTGVLGDNTPSLLFSTSTGRPNFKAGSATASTTFDTRDGNWHISRCIHDLPGTSLKFNLDRARSTTTATGASVAPSTTAVNALTLGIGIRLNELAAGSSAFFGQWSALLAFNTVLSDANIVIVENYLAAKYGVTLV